MGYFSALSARNAHQASLMKIAILFDNFGPYHLARLEAASRVCTLLAVQINQRSRDYAWAPSQGHYGFKSITLNQADGCLRWSSLFHNRRLIRALANFAPNCVFIPGWSRSYSLAALLWCQTNSVPTVMMSESTEQDSARAACKEWLKTRILRLCCAALVGGSAHAQYLGKLGMSHERIFDGYDIVDNEYFHRSTKAVRLRGKELRAQFGLANQYFLASARFIEKKNLRTLVEAYARYRDETGPSSHGTSQSKTGQPWSMVVLGDGPQKRAIEKLISKLRLESCVRLPGFSQYQELPVYYGLASAFVHASMSEPWGLVINEAMASGLPVLVSNRCGCVPELVCEEGNGFSFDPGNVHQLSRLMGRLASAGPELVKLSIASQERVSDWGPRRFARGFQAAAEKAIEQKWQRPAALPSTMLPQLSR